MFRRRPKVAQEPDSAVGRRAERRSKKRAKAEPPAPLPVAEQQAGAGDEAASSEPTEPWYRQSGPLFEESFSDGPPAPASQPPGGDAAAAEFAPPPPADPAAVASTGSVPTIQRVGHVTDPGPLGEEMRGAFGPESGADVGSAADEVPGAADADDSRYDTGAPDQLIDFDGTDDGEAPEDSADDATSGDDGEGDTADEPVDDAEPSDAADDESAPDEDPADQDALPAVAPSSEVAQHEPPMVVPVRGYYIARTEDTLRSVAAQFLNAPERWFELRSLNAAYPGIADLDPDELVPEGAALALPGDPLPWGRPDPVYLWTLAETFLFTAWGREPSPEEVVPFWRGLTQGALPEGEQSPLGIELPDVAEIAARSADGPDAPPPSADAPPAPPSAFEMPAVAEPELAGDIDLEEVDAEQDADTAVGIDLETTPVEEPQDLPSDTAPAAVAPEEADAELEPIAAADEAAPAEDAEPAQPASEVTFRIEPVAPAPPHDDVEPDAFDAADAADAPAEIAEEADVDVEATATDAVDAPAPVARTAELAGLVQAVEEAIDESIWPDAEDGVDIEGGPADMSPFDDIVDAEIVEEPVAEAEAVEPEPPVAETPVAEPPLAEPPAATMPPVEPPPVEPPPVEPSAAAPPAAEAPVAEPPVAETPAVPSPPVAPPPVFGDPTAAAEPVLEPPPTFEEWIDEPAATSSLTDPLAPYAGMPGASTAEAPPRPPEAEAPRVPHFLPSVTGTTPGGLTTAVQTSPVGRSLAGTAVGDAMLLWQLARRRRQGRRAAGVPDAIEQSLLQSAGGESLELIEAAMRHLYAVTIGQQRPKPNVLAVRSGTYGFEVLLDRPVPTPPGWRSASGGFVLELPQGVTARDLGAIGHGPSLCPSLVPVGNTFEGPLLLNLEQLGCLAVSGPSAPAASLLHAIVGTLGSSPMASHLRITAVSLDDAAGMIGWEDVSFASYDSPELETLFAHAYGPGDGMIDLLVIGPGNDLLIQRAGQVATAPESRLSLVGATSAVSARWPWRIHVDDTGTAVVHPISITMTAARAVPPETLAQFGGAQFGAAPSGGNPAGLR